MTTTTTAAATSIPALLALRLHQVLADVTAQAGPVPALEQLRAVVIDLTAELAYVSHERDTARARVDALLLDLAAADPQAAAVAGLLHDVQRLSERLARKGSER